ncbi:hypothetical protein [Thiomicrorhabdus aquaedulcis]|uniref:hypothetical protein n=1 Tax=Thiomicrorhabdus aquaedulcis TaxID=2211106 RepID=UPI000FD76CDB|nr:hypothetical protein [Thiomicrorhabdus aquaedulcis]
MFSRKDPQEEVAAPTDQEANELLAKWTKAEEIKKNEYDRFERVKQLQDALDTETKGKAPDIYSGIQRFLAILPSKVQDFGRQVEKSITSMSKNSITSEVMGLYLYALHAPERDTS